MSKSKSAVKSGNTPYPGAFLNSAGLLNVWKTIPGSAEDYTVEIKFRESDHRPIIVERIKIVATGHYVETRMAWLEPLHSTVPKTGNGDTGIPNHCYSRSAWYDAKTQDGPYDPEKARPEGGQSIEFIIEAATMEMRWLRILNDPCQRWDMLTPLQGNAHNSVEAES
ncbi:hypothetical protein BDP67DRAFT_484924 [Colletotrichum lupini]|nr:hypothetical protein BDP67DRAFT_484924 [Colletotrichum lupini]